MKNSQNTKALEMWEVRHGAEQHQGEQQSPLAGEL